MLPPCCYCYMPCGCCVVVPVTVVVFWALWCRRRRRRHIQRRVEMVVVMVVAEWLRWTSWVCVGRSSPSLTTRWRWWKLLLSSSRSIPNYIEKITLVKKREE